MKAFLLAVFLFCTSLGAYAQIAQPPQGSLYCLQDQQPSGDIAVCVYEQALVVANDPNNNHKCPVDVHAVRWDYNGSTWGLVAEWSVPDPNTNLCSEEGSLVIAHTSQKPVCPTGTYPQGTHGQCYCPAMTIWGITVPQYWNDYWSSCIPTSDKVFLPLQPGEQR